MKPVCDGVDGITGPGGSDDPARRRLYEYLAVGSEFTGRDDAAAARRRRVGHVTSR